MINLGRNSNISHSRNGLKVYLCGYLQILMMFLHSVACDKPALEQNSKGPASITDVRGGQLNFNQSFNHPGSRSILNHIKPSLKIRMDPLPPSEIFVPSSDEREGIAKLANNNSLNTDSKITLEKYYEISKLKDNSKLNHLKKQRTRLTRQTNTNNLQPAPISKSRLLEDDTTVLDARRPVRQLAVREGTRHILDCDAPPAAHSLRPGDIEAPPHHTPYVERIVTWRKLGIEVPIFIQFNGYPPHIDASYEGRIRLTDSSGVMKAGLELSDISIYDEGYYECSIVLLVGGGTHRQEMNGTRLHLIVNSPPVIITSPAELVLIDNNKPDYISCAATGRPAPTFTWIKNGLPLTLTPRIRLESSSLPEEGSNVSGNGSAGADNEIVTSSILYVLPHTRKMTPHYFNSMGFNVPDGSALKSTSVSPDVEGDLNGEPLDGMYMCVASNEMGKDSKQFRIVVDNEGARKTEVNSNNASVTVGSRLTLKCLDNIRQVTSESLTLSNLSFHWLKNGNDVTLLNDVISRLNIDSEGNLHLNGVTRNDRGIYTCNRTTKSSKPSTSSVVYNVSILYPPTIGALPAKLFLARGLYGRLDCPITDLGYPPATITTWSCDGRLVDVTRTTRMHVDSRGSLEIRPVMKEDEGEYSCTPMSSVGVGSTSSPVQIVVKDPPHIEMRPRDLYQRRVSQSISFPCAVIADPTATIEWRKMDGILTPSSRILIEGGNLTIQHITQADQGVYECVASNVVATAVASTLLLVESMDSHAPYNVSVRTQRNTARLDWFPAYDIGYRIHYVVWYRSISGKKQEDWSTVRVMRPDLYQMTLYNLTPDTQYQFCVLARSSSGLEQFSAIVTATTKGDKFDDDGDGDGEYEYWEIEGYTKKWFVDREDWGWEDSARRPPADSGGDMENLTQEKKFGWKDNMKYDQAQGQGQGQDHYGVDDETASKYHLQLGHKIDTRLVPPTNVTVRQQKNALLISWLPSSLNHPQVHHQLSPSGGLSEEVAVARTQDLETRISEPALEGYVIQYRTVGPWVNLTGIIAASSGRTWFEWTTASRGVKYHFRVIAWSKEGVSGLPSHEVSFSASESSYRERRIPEGLLAGVLSGVAAVIVLVVLIVVCVKLIKRRRRRKKEQRYDCVKFYGPSNQSDSIPSLSRSHLHSFETTELSEEPRCLHMNSTV